MLRKRAEEAPVEGVKGEKLSAAEYSRVKYAGLIPLTTTGWEANRAGDPGSNPGRSTILKYSYKLGFECFVTLSKKV